MPLRTRGASALASNLHAHRELRKAVFLTVPGLKLNRKLNAENEDNSVAVKECINDIKDVRKENEEPPA